MSDSFATRPGSSVHGISQARILEWVTTSFSRGCSRPKDTTKVSSIAGGFFTAEPLGKPKVIKVLGILRSVSHSVHVDGAPGSETEINHQGMKIQQTFLDRGVLRRERYWMPGGKRGLGDLVPSPQ